MKNFLVLCVTAALGCLGYDAFRQPLPPPHAARVAMAAPLVPTAAPRVYFHSALDAPAMPTGMTSGSSYFSADPESQFAPRYVYSAADDDANRGATYIVTPGGKASAPASPDNFSAAPVRPPLARNLSYLQENVVRALQNSDGAAR